MQQFVDKLFLVRREFCFICCCLHCKQWEQIMKWLLIGSKTNKTSRPIQY